MKLRAVICRLTLASLIFASPLSSFASDDDRNTTVLRPKERAMMLEDMRNYLQGIKRITLAIAKKICMELKDRPARWVTSRSTKSNPTWLPR